MTLKKHLGIWNVGKGKYYIELIMYGTNGNGLCGLLTGGEKPHIGGVAYAEPRPKTQGQGLTSDISTICGHGHKDVCMASKAADMISRATNETTSISAGIHIDHASKDELKLLVANINTVVEMFINDYENGFNQKLG